MMVSAASSASNTVATSPVIANAAPPSSASNATATDEASVPAASPSAPASTSSSTTTTPGANAAQANSQATASASPRATQGTETIPRFSDMLRAANDEDDADGDASTKSAAAPKTDAADPSEDDTHSDATASTAIALAMWPGMAAPVTVVPNGTVLSAQPSSTGRTGRGASVTDADAAPVADVASGAAAPFSADLPRGTAVGGSIDTKQPDAGAAVGADTSAPAKRAVGFRPAMDDASAAPDTARASARPDTTTAAAPRERAATNAALPTLNTSTLPNAAGWSTPVNAASASDTQPVTVKLPPQSPDQWNQPLTDALGDRLQVQLGHGSEQAVIRLDPPMLGSIEISIRHEAGSLQVQLSASNGDVLRQLHGIGDTLRQDLSQRQSGDVSVVVSDSSRDANGADSQRGRGRQRDAQTADDGPGRALAEAETEPARTPFSFARERE